MLSQGRISSNFLMHTEFRIKPNFRIRFDISMKSTCNFKIRFDFGFKPNFSIKPVLKRDSQFNSILGSKMKRSLAKFIINIQYCTQ